MLVFEGPAGIGKSSLLDAVAASGTGMHVARASPTSLERPFAFGVVRRLFGALGDRAPLRGPEAAAARALGEPRGRLSGASQAVLYGLLWMLTDAAAQEPILWTIDDAQWADNASVAFLRYAASRLTELPVAIVVATRPPPPAEHGHGVQVLSLPPLSAPAAEELLARSLGAEVARGRVAAAIEVTGGNPYLLGELIRGWRESESAAAMPTTETLRRTVAQRVAQVGNDAVRLADAVAILGGARVELRHGAALADLLLDAAAGAADALRAAASPR